MSASKRIIDNISTHDLCHFKNIRHSHNFRNFLHKFVPYNNEKIKWFE